jgi:hypothetical protein
MSENKDYFDGLKAQLKTWVSKIDELRGKADKVNLERRIESNRKIAGMYGKIKAIELTVNELENEAVEPTDGHVRRIESEFNELAKEFTMTASRLE